MDDEDDFGGYGSDEPSVRVTRKPIASTSTAPGKRKPSTAKTSLASSSTTAKAVKAGARGGAARARGKAAGTRGRGRPKAVQETRDDERAQDDEQEVIDIEADVGSEDEKDEENEKDDEDVDMDDPEPEPVRAGRPKRGETAKETANSSKPSSKAGAPESKVSKGKSTAVSGTEDKTTSREQDLERELTKIKSQLTRRTEERDSLDKQFKELSAKKGGEMERLYDKLKEKSEDQVRAQDKIIETLEQLNKKLNSHVVVLEQSLGENKKNSTSHEDRLREEKSRAEKLEKEKKELQAALDKASAVPPAAPLPPDVKKLEEEVKEWKAQVNVYKGKVKEKQTEINTLTQDLEQEVKISKAALAESQRQAAAMSKMTKSPGVSTSAKDVAADREQNEQIIKLYEDMTNLMVPKVNIVRGGNGEEVTFVCVQTVDGRSMSFKLKIYKKASPDPAQPGSWIYTKVMRYIPLDLELQDQAFVNALGVFKDSLEMPMDQAMAFWTNLRDSMTQDEEE